MKKFLFFVACAFAALSVSAAPQEVEFGKLPQNSQEFIRRCFPGEKVKRVELDREASWDKYTVYFNSGSEVSFEGGSGDCSQIIMTNGSVPPAALPARVRTYLSGKYAGQAVKKFETTKEGYRVCLSDRTCVDFDSDGRFVKASR